MSKKVSTSKQAGKAGQSSKQAKAEEQLIDSPLEQAAAQAPKKEVVAKTTKAKGRKPVVPESRDDEVEERAEYSDEEPIEVALDEGDAGGAYTVLTSTTTNDDQDKAAAPQDRSNTGVILAALGGLAALGSGSSSGGPLVPAEPTDFIDIVRNEDVFVSPNVVDAEGEIETTRLVRHVTVVSPTDLSEANLLVNTAGEPVRLFSSSRVTVDAQGDNSTSFLALNSTGSANTLSVKASGANSSAIASVAHTGNFSGGVTVEATGGANGDESDWLHTIDLSTYVPRVGDVVTLTIAGSAYEYTVQSGDIVENNSDASRANVIANLSLEAELYLGYDPILNQLVLNSFGDTPYGNAELVVDAADYEASVDTVGGEEYTLDEIQSINLSSFDISGYESGDVVTLSFGDTQITYTLTSTDDGLDDIVSGLEAQLDDSMNLAISLDGSNLVLTWDDGEDYAAATLSVSEDTFTASQDVDGGKYLTNEVQVIDLTNYSLQIGDKLTLSLGNGIDLEHTVASTDVQAIITALQNQINSLELDLTISADQDNLTLTWTDEVDHPLASFKVGETSFQDAMPIGAFLDMQMDGTIGTGITVTATSQNDTAEALIAGNLIVQGEVAVTASGEDAYADLGINAYRQILNYQVAVNGEDDGAVSLALSSLEVAAQADGAYAGAAIINASGNAGDVTVSAEGTAEVQTFDFLSNFGPGQGNNRLANGDTFSVQIGSETLSYTWVSTQPGNYTQQLKDVVAAFKEQVEEKHLDVVFSSTSDGKLVATWTRVGDEDLIDVKVERSGSPDRTFEMVETVTGDESSAAELDVRVDETFGADLDIDSLTVQAISAYGDASANIYGALSVNGDVLVSASGVGASAEVDLNYSNLIDQTTFTQQGNITVEATEDGATALLAVGNAAGSAGEVSVLSTADDYAGLSLQVRATETLSIEGLTVHANSLGTVGASAEVNIDGETGVGDEVAGTLAVSGEISVLASSSGDVASLALNQQDGLAVLAVDAVTVTADGNEASASASMNGLSGSVGELNVSASGSIDSCNVSTASVDMQVAKNERLTIETVSVIASSSGSDTSGFAQATAQLSGESGGTTDDNGIVAIDDNIVVSALGEDDQATLNVNTNCDSGSTVLGGGDITITADGDGSNANAYLINTSGVANALLVTASGAYAAQAGLTITTESLDGVEGLSIESMTVEANEQSAVAITTVSGTLAIAENIAVTASSADADAVALLVGQVSLDGGDVVATASGAFSSADIDIHASSGTVDALTVSATGLSADAHLNITINSLDVDGLSAQSITVTAVNVSADAQAIIVGDMSFDADITVTASSADAHALAYLIGQGNVSLGGGDVDVTASGDRSSADVDIQNASGSVDEITITASGISTDAYLSMTVDSLDANGLFVTSLTVDASDANASAEANIMGDVDISSDITVTASSVDASSIATVNGYAVDNQYVTTARDNSGLTHLGGGDITVTASAIGSTADAHIYNASGDINAVEVTASGSEDNCDTSTANLMVEVSANETLTIQTVEVTANSTNGTISGEAIATADFSGESGDAIDPWSDSLNANDDVAGTVHIVGDISVTASGHDDDAVLTVNASNGPQFVQGRTQLGGGDLTVIAEATGAVAVADIQNARGTLADIKVSAEGAAEVQGYDFLNLHDSGSTPFVYGNRFNLLINGETLFYDFTTDVMLQEGLNVNVHLAQVIASFNNQARDLGLDVTFSGTQTFADGTTFEGLVLTWGRLTESQSDEVAVNVRIDKYDGNTLQTTGSLIPLTGVPQPNVGNFAIDGTTNSNAYLNLQTGSTGVTVDTFTVLASAENSDSSADVSGTFEIEGAISVSAIGLDSDARALINIDDRNTTLGGGDLTVLASAWSADASLVMGNTLGDVGAVNVSALGDQSNATLYMEAEATETLTLASLHVHAASSMDDGESNASVDVVLEGESGFGNDESGVVAITGDITVMASGSADTASLMVNADGSTGHTELGGGDILVSASASAASADAEIYNASGSVGSVDVAASGNIASGDISLASLSLDVSVNETVTIQTVSVIAESANISLDGHSVAWADLWGQSGGTTDVDGVVRIVSDINVSALGGEDDASLYVNSYGYLNQSSLGDEDLGFTSLGGGNISVTAAGDIASADAYIDNTSGSADAITVTASGISAEAYLGITTESLDGVEGLSFTSLTVTANNLEASADAHLFGDLTISDNITVTASSEDSHAFTLLQGEITLGGGDITVTASATSADAGVVIMAADGDVGALDVSALGSIASGDISIARMDADVWLNDTLTIQTVSVTASSTGSTDGYSVALVDLASQWAAPESTDVSGVVEIRGSIDVSANGEFDVAVLSVNSYIGQTFDVVPEFDDFGHTVLGGGDITVAAQGDHASADVYLVNTSGTSGAMSVTASKTGSEAFLGIATENYNVDGLSALSLSVEANGFSAEAEANIMGNVAISDDITVTASSVDALGGIWINELPPEFIGLSFDAGETQLGGGDIRVTASATGASADGVIYNANGSVGSVDVTATGDIASGDISWAGLSLDVSVNEIVTIQTVSVVAESDNISLDGHSVAWADLWGQSGGTTDVDGVVRIVSDINVSALGGEDDATLYVNSYGNMPFPATEENDLGYTSLGGGDINVTAAGDVASADAYIDNTSGSADVITVTASGINAEAYLGITTESLNNVEGLTFTSLAVNASNVGASADAYMAGTVSVNGDITVTASSADAWAVASINGGPSKYNGEPTVGVTELGGGDILVSASASGASADAYIYNASGNVGSMDVMASGAMAQAEYSSAYLDVEVDSDDTLTIQTVSVVANSTSVSSDGHAHADLYITGNSAEVGDARGTVVFSDSITVSALGEEDIAYADVDGHVEFVGLSNDITVTAFGQSSDAELVIGDAVGVIEDVLVHTNAQDARGVLDITFEDRVTGDTGSIEDLTINAEHHRSAAIVLLEQTDYNGAVTVQGEGHAALTYYVDEASATAKTIDLSPMHSTSTSADAVDGEDLWGFADLDLVALNGVGFRADNPFDVIAKSIQINGLNVDRDSINIMNALVDFGVNDISRDHVHFHEDHTVWSVDASQMLISDLPIYTDHPDYVLARLQVVQDAYDYFEDFQSSDVDVGFFYREVEFDFFGLPTEKYSFLVYDFDPNATGISGLIELGATTGLSELNVADRYSITHSTLGSAEIASQELDFGSFDVHVIDHLSVYADSSDITALTYTVDSTDVISLRDITVSAIQSSDAHLVFDVDASADVILRQSDILVSADGASADAYLAMDNVRGTVSSLTVEVDQGGYASVDIAGVSADADGFALHFREIDLRVMGADSSLDVHITNADFGGDVMISGSSQDYYHGASGDLVSNVVNLTFEGDTAQNITIDNTGRSFDINESVDETIQLNLALLVEDADHDAVVSTWVDKMIQIEGWTMNDRLSFYADSASIEMTNPLESPATLQDLFEAASESLEGLGGTGQNHFFFGSFGGNGYLFYDRDLNEGVNEGGFTTVIELVGVTTFVPEQLIEVGVTPPPIDPNPNPI